MNFIALLPIFASKKSRRKKIAETMLPSMFPVTDETQRLAFAAMTADQSVRSEEREVDRVADEVLAASEQIASSLSGRLSDQQLASLPKLKQLVERRPEFRSSLEQRASRFFTQGQAQVGFDRVAGQLIDLAIIAKEAESLVTDELLERHPEIQAIFKRNNEFIIRLNTILG